MKHPEVVKTLTLFIFFTLGANVSLAAGGSGTGGGQDTVSAFNANVKTLVDWLQEHGQKLNPPISPEAFFAAADPGKIIPINDDSRVRSSKDTFSAVTKQCDGHRPVNSSDLRTACYNSKSKNIYLSESRYPSDSTSPSVLGVTAHEVLRKMGVESDGYEVSRQIDIVNIAGASVMSGNSSWMICKAKNHPDAHSAFVPVVMLYEYHVQDQWKTEVYLNYGAYLMVGSYIEGDSNSGSIELRWVQHPSKKLFVGTISVNDDGSIKLVGSSDIAGESEKYNFTLPCEQM